MTSHSPFFSIVIPAYNRKSFLPDTLRSIFNQTFDDFEVILVDDGSNDGTKEWIETTWNKEPRLKYLYQVNSERGAARNNGTQNAKGQYVVYFDSDDLMHPDHLAVLKATIEQHPSVLFFSTKHRFLRNSIYYYPPINKFKAGLYNYQILLNGNPVGVLFCMKNNIPELIPFPEDRDLASMEDWLFLFSNLIKHSILIIDQVTITVNDHDNRSMRFNEEVIKRRIRAGKWIKEHIPLSHAEQNLLDGHTDYFNAVHHYAADQKKEALNALTSSIKQLGISLPAIQLFIKILVGYKTIQHFK